MPGMEETAPQDPGDQKLRVSFYMGAVKDAAASDEAGRPIYKDVPFIRILIPGNKDEIFEQPAWLDPRHPRSHVSRFPVAWARFQAGAKEAEVGTPLSLWPGVTRGQVEMLAFLEVKTVEQLSGLSDALAQKFMGGNDLRQKAQAYVERANQDAPAEKMRMELGKRDEQIAALTRQMAELSAASKLAAPQALPPPKQEHARR